MAKFIATEVKDVPDYQKIGDLKSQLVIPEDRDIVKILREGVVARLSDSDKTQPEGVYVDVPRYRRGAGNINIARMEAEINLLRTALRQEINIISNPPHYTYIIIKDLPLGLEYTPRNSHVLIKLPPEYPQIPPGLSPSYGIYLTGGLRRNNASLECEKHQYHWDCEHNPDEMKKKNWAWWCFAELNNWDPWRDNLFKVVVILTETLQNPDKQNF